MNNCNGAVNISIDGGSLDYSYEWSNGDTSQDIFNICEDQSPLTVVVTDDVTGCIVQSQDFILIAGLSIALESNNETCAGEADGSIIASVAGGIPGYTYLWSNGATTPNITGLIPDTYTLTVTDSQGNTESESAMINGSSTALSATSVVTTPTGANADGSINLTISGGTPTYLYEWTFNGMFFSDNQDISGLLPGTYTVEITDAFGCTISQSFNLVGAAISLQFISGSTGCPGQSGLGTLQVVPSGGSGSDFTYLWNVTDQDPTGDIIGGLEPGDFTVTVTDGTGLTAVGTGTNVPLEEITIELEVDEIEGNIFSTVTGGTAPYTYQWNDPDFSVTADLTGVPSGTYTLVVVDTNGCVSQATAELLAGPCENVRRVITPNNDGFNDEFIVSCANRFDIELEIYNRWGQLEFLAANYDNSWEGTDMEGGNLPEGGYFYVIRYLDSEGQTQQIRGALNIVY